MSVTHRVGQASRLPRVWATLATGTVAPRGYSVMWSSSRWNSSRLPNGITIRPAPLPLACTTTFTPSAWRSWFSTAVIWLDRRVAGRPGLRFGAAAGATDAPLSSSSSAGATGADQRQRPRRPRRRPRGRSGRRHPQAGGVDVDEPRSPAGPLSPERTRGPRGPRDDCDGDDDGGVVCATQRLTENPSDAEVLCGATAPHPRRHSGLTQIAKPILRQPLRLRRTGPRGS